MTAGPCSDAAPPGGRRVPWWTPDWEAWLSGSPGVGPPGRTGAAVSTAELLAASTSTQVLRLWPRLDARQREAVVQRALDGLLDGPVCGPLLACFVAEVDDDVLDEPDEDAREPLDRLAGVPVDLSTLRALSVHPVTAAGPLAGSMVGDRFARGVAGIAGVALRRAFVDAGVLSPHLSYAQALTLLPSDPAAALARLDAPYARVVTAVWGEEAPSPTRGHDRWLALKHPDFPAGELETYLASTPSNDVLRALRTPVSAAFARSVLSSRRRDLRILVPVLSPPAARKALDPIHLPPAVWRRLAHRFSPHVDGYADPFLTHPVSSVRTAYVRAHAHRHLQVTQRALADPSAGVRAALARATVDPDVLGQLAADPSARVRQAAADRLLSALTR